MHKIFVPLYRFFEAHKALMYTIMAATALLFVSVGVHIRFEEDLTQLIPSQGSSAKGLAFGNLKVKDKIFVQITSASEAVSPYNLSGYAEDLVDAFVSRDPDSTYVESYLYNLKQLVPSQEAGEDLSMDALIRYLPSFVDTAAYARMDALLSPAVLDARMERNKRWIELDSTIFVYEPDSLTYYPVTTGDLVSMDPVGLVPAILGVDGGSSRALLRSVPYAVVDGQLFSRDTTVAYIFIAPAFKSMDTSSGGTLVEMLEEESLAFMAAHPEVEVYIHGSPVRGVNNSRRIKQDLFLTVGLSLLVILAVIVLCFRDWKIIPFQLLPVLYGSAFALACIYWIKGSVSLMAMGLGAIVLGVALSYCLHLIIHHKYVGDAEKMLRDESTPVVLGCLTTVGAFLGLLFTQSELLQDFGLFASLALVGSTLFALIFLPHFLRKGDTRKNETIIRLIDRYNNIQFDRSRGLMIVITLITLLCIGFSFKIGFDDDLRNLGYYSERTLASEKLYSEKTLDRDSIQAYYAATADNLDDALRYNREVVRVIDSLQRAGVVHKYAGFVDKVFVPEDIQAQRIAAWNAYWTEEKIAQWRSAIRQSCRRVGLVGEYDLFLYDYVIEDDAQELVLKSYEPVQIYDSGLIPMSLLANFIERSEDGRYLVFTSVNLNTQAEKDAVSDAVTRHRTAEHALAIDPMYYIQDMVDIVHDDFNLAVGISSIFVLLVLLLSFKSIWSALLAFLPMALSWYVVQGAMYLCGIQFNLINIVISTFIFGVGVDYSIFVMEGLLSVARTDGNRNLLVWHKSAIFFSAFVLIVVTLSLMFAVHPSISSIGLVTLIGMVTTIVFTYTIQPWIFRQMMKSDYFRRAFCKQ